jgi:hypothetical protein
VKTYFRREAESELGCGSFYVEIIDGWPRRQVEVYGGEWRWGDLAHPEHLADQPVEVLDLTEEHAMTANEFERLWEEAQRRCPPSS